jgi:SecD/SecF fusion protein
VRSLLGIRSIFVLALIVLSIYGLVPSIKYYSMSNEQITEKEAIADPAFAEMKSKILNLGLDLQGGIHLVVEIDVESFLERLAERPDDILREQTKIASKDEQNPIKTLRRLLNDKGTDLVRYFGSRNNRARDSDEEVTEILEEQLNSAIDRAREIISNRIDQFGVAEPIIQKLGERRIAIELAGAKDFSRIRSIVNKTAQLDFSILSEPDLAEKVIKAANDYYKIKYDVKSSVEDTTETEEKTETKNANDIFGVNNNSSKDSVSASEGIGSESKYDQELFLPYSNEVKQLAIILAKNKGIVDDLLKDSEFKKYIHTQTGSNRILYVKDRTPAGQQTSAYQVIVVRDYIEMTGDGITDAKTLLDPESFNNQYYVALKLDDKSASKFYTVSKRYYQKKLAIILDDVVQSFPIFQAKDGIPGGNVSISGMDQDEAKDLSIILKSGALPAPLKVMEEETVGASLGADSVEDGTRSIIFGLTLVLVFMIIYYKRAGIIASFAVILNLVFMAAALAGFNGTLTLPGIAGIILTIGMSVDANVLIFERIREEIADGVTAFKALQNGYSRAIVAILDANITTFIAGVVLYSFGSGSIRGFALTLMIGIVSSLITAVIMTRVIFESTTKPNATTISI